jgi:hypothetical protein
MKGTLAIKVIVDEEEFEFEMSNEQSILEAALKTRYRRSLFLPRWYLQ